MALRGTLTHRKTRRLARILGIHPCFALGILEALWHFTAEQHPTGDLTAMRPIDIAEEMFYDGDAQELYVALFESEWLEKLDSGIVYVHDWHEHADSFVHAWLAKRTMFFANGTAPKIPHEAFDAPTRSRIKAEYSRVLPRTPGELPETPGELPSIPIPEPVNLETKTAGAREDGADPWANDEGFSPEVMKADREWGDHMFRKYQHVRDSECILADRRFLVKQADPDECVNLAIRSGWRTLKPVFGQPNGKARGYARPPADERKHPDAEHDYDVRAIQEKGETVMVRFEKGSKTKLFDEAGWYAKRGLGAPGGTVLPPSQCASLTGLPPASQGAGIDDMTIGQMSKWAGV